MTVKAIVTCQPGSGGKNLIKANQHVAVDFLHSNIPTHQPIEILFVIDDDRILHLGW